MTTIYVGNLPFNATEQDVKALFERHGKVESVKLIKRPGNRQNRVVFGFVDMPQAEAQSAIQALNGFQMNGRPLRVKRSTGAPTNAPRQGGGPFPPLTICATLREQKTPPRAGFFFGVHQLLCAFGRAHMKRG